MNRWGPAQSGSSASASNARPSTPSCSAQPPRFPDATYSTEQIIKGGSNALAAGGAPQTAGSSLSMEPGQGLFPATPGNPTGALGGKQQQNKTHMQMKDAREVSVPVVVLGANLGGLAAAVAIRSRTGRAVWVIDLGEDRQREHSEPCVLSARSLDAMRAINADMHKAVLASVAGEAATRSSSTKCSIDGPLRLESSVLKEILIEHLTGGAGGSSCVWRPAPLQQIVYHAQKEKQEGVRTADATFADGVVVRTDLVVVASEDFPAIGFLQAQANDTPYVEGVAPLPQGVKDGLWLLQDASGIDAVLISDVEKQIVTYAAASSIPALCLESPRSEAATVAKQIIEELQAKETESKAEMLRAVLAEIRARPTSVNTRTVKCADRPWSFWGGRLVLTGDAAHPLASLLGDGLELALEDAAQLGCSLFDWKFAVRLASDRYQAIRKRRLASIRASPKAKEWTGDSPEAVCGTSTVATSPEALLEEDQMFVPTRDAYAALLPASGLGYDVQEAEFS